MTLTPSPAPMQLARLRHWGEIGNTLLKRPEVIVFDAQSCAFGEAWQWVSYNINTTLNEFVTENLLKKQWRAVHDWMRAFHNGTGFGESGDPRWDYVNNMNKNSPLPKYDKTRSCGGGVHLVKGISYSGLQAVRETFDTIKKSIQSPRAMYGSFISSIQDAITADNMVTLACLNGNQEPPTSVKYPNPTKWLLAHYWFMFDAVNVGSTSRTLFPFPQGKGQRVFVPFVSNKSTVQYPLSKVELLSSNFNHKTYNPFAW